MKRFFVALFLSAVMYGAGAQGFSGWFSSEIEASVPSFPIDPNIYHGTLDNGLTYYVLDNKNEPQKAEFYLLLRVGSILEEDNQQGFTHLIERMAAFGTKNFHGSSMGEFFHRNGILPDNIDTYTSFDDSGFILSDITISRENKAMIDSCLLVLHDWGRFMNFEQDVMDQARGWIESERSKFKAPIHRMFENEILPKLMSETHYAQRHPIGDKKVLEKCTIQDVKEYYDKWYRPDLQAVVVVGDIDASYVEKRIKEIWSDVEAPVNPTPRTYEQIAENSRPIGAVASDKEYTQNMIRFGTKITKISPKLRNSQIGFTRAFIRDVQAEAFEQRLDKVLSDKNSPLVSVHAEIDDYLVSKSKRTMNFTIIYKDNRWKEALSYIMGLVADIYDNGYTDEELEIAKSVIRKQIELIYQEHNNRTNEYWADRIKGNFLDSKPLIDIDLYYHMSTQLLDVLPNEAYHEIFRQLVDAKQSHYIFCIGQDAENIILPTEKELISTYEGFLNRTKK